MDCIEAILGRRSCRAFTNQIVEDEKLQKILTCATYAPSPVNKQPWEFIVVRNRAYNHKLQEEAEKVKSYIAERSKWKWVSKYKVDFISQAPVLIIVVGDPSKNGAEQFLNTPVNGYKQACAAAIENICIAAHCLGLGTLWFSLFEAKSAREIFSIASDKDPVGIICLGYPAKELVAPPRKAVCEKVQYID